MSTAPPPPPRLPIAFVHSDAQWEAIASPARCELLQTLQARGPSSIPELAHLLDAAPDGLYHHARALEKAGLIRVVERRVVGKRTERVYDAVSGRLRLDVNPAEARNGSRLVSLARVYGARALKLLSRAMDARTGRLDGPAPDTVVHADAAWLDEHDLARVTALVDELRDVFEHARTRRRGTLVSLTLLMSPLVRPRSSTDRKTARQEALSRDLSHAPRARARRMR